MAIYIGNTAVKPNATKVYVGSNLVYQESEPNGSLCFTANTAGSTVELTIYGAPSIANSAYSLDGTNWTTFTPSTTSGTNTITLANAGDKVYFRNDITANFSTSNYMKFVMSGSIAASGNCNSIYSSTGYNDLTTLIYKYCYYNIFFNCTSLTTAPELPATTLAQYSYADMFYNCTALTTAPALPATTLANYCYEYMFRACTSLVTAPALPATALANYCYYGMFTNCESLTTAPTLSATDLAQSCYLGMFQDCTALTSAPVLPATTLAYDCYDGMFSGCTALTAAPALPATTAVYCCYKSMFYGCTALTTAPALPATTLANYCYERMFYNCTALTAVPSLAVTTLAEGCYSGMFQGCTSLQVSDTQTSAAPYVWAIPTSGTFTNTTTYNQSSMFTNCLGTRSSSDMSGAQGESHTYYTQNFNGYYAIVPTLTNVTAAAGNPTTIRAGATETLTFTASSGYSLPDTITVTGATSTWVKSTGTLTISNPTADVTFSITGIDETLAVPLCFTANTAGSTVELTKVGSPSIANTAYSLDGTNWTTFTPSTTAGTNTITLANVGDKVYFRNDITDNFRRKNILQFVMSGSIAASGNCNSMHDSVNFSSLTTLNNYCYSNMFLECTSLTTPPVLPATTLANNCYQSMFYGCTSLTQAPALPATTLATYCYAYMFYGCTSLAIAPIELSATTLDTYCYIEMFRDCTSLTTVPKLPATTLTFSCYRNMFYNCTSLTQVPALPATTLESYGYAGMFYGCTSLYVSDEQTSEAPHAWVIPSSGTFTDSWTLSNMFYNCLGTRSSDDMSGAQGESNTYYTQNEPIS